MSRMKGTTQYWSLIGNGRCESIGERAASSALPPLYFRPRLGGVPARSAF